MKTQNATNDFSRAVLIGKKILRPINALVLAGAFAGTGFSATALAEDHWGRHEQLIRDYYAGWEEKRWDKVDAQLAEGFSFTSPAPDDHIPTPAFKAKCWNQAAHIERFDFIHVHGDADALFVLLHVVTTDGRTIRNLEYFTFRDGKIASIEVFFGGTGQGYPTNAQAKQSTDT
jgi:ketosteroid isomerase-like protein